ncbi:hypothetical protein P4133_22750 [Pseudomonas aeruginosa]|nr:hypothetical protein [Pseudomonas aeruginosa]
MASLARRNPPPTGRAISPCPPSWSVSTARSAHSTAPLESAGNPFFLPSLARLWQRQAGYRWHGISGERLSGWQDDWLVVADQGADPFILETGSGRILFDLHGGRGWDPAPCFDDLWQMAASLACFGEVWSGAGEDILLDDCSVAPRYRQQLVDELQPILGSAPAGGGPRRRVRLVSW